MARYRFGEIVKDIKIKIDRNRNSYEFYVAGNHMETENLSIPFRGRFEDDDVGPAFIRLFRPGQVLYGSRRTYLKKVAVADFEGVTSNTTFVFESACETIFTQRLLPFLMLSDSFTKYSIMKSRGSTNPYVLFSDLADYEVELPGIEEQHKLADLFWSFNNTKNAYNNLLLATDDLVKSQFIEMFGDPLLPSDSILIKRLGDICNMRAGKFVKADDISPLQKEGLYPCYGGNGRRGYIDRFTHEGSYPLIGRQGALCGNVQYTTGKFYATEHAIVVQPNIPLNTFWLYQALILLNLNRLAIGAAQPGLTVERIAEVRIAVPLLDTQTRFSTFVEQSDKSKFALQQNIEKLEQCRNALLQKSFG